MKIFKKMFGTYSEREIKKLIPIVDEIEALEEKIQKFSEEELKGMTNKFKERLENGETLDDILPEAFAVVREAALRVLGQRAFKTQILGGVVLHQGRISEMKTGEGKTLAATFPLYLNALLGKGSHLITVNDYLASYQGKLMGKVYNYLDLSVGLVVHGQTNAEKRDAYASDITYGTNNEFGFDYLRDNMVIHKQNMAQRDRYFAIVDEVDSILIDEARTPLIISGAGDKSTDMYQKAHVFALKLRKQVFKEVDDKEQMDDIDADYIVEEKVHTATLTASGINKAEKYFGVENLSDSENATLQHHINQSLKANSLMKKEKDYVVKDGQVLIVDEFTGRLMIGRRYSDGLHQAIEAKEGVKVERESKTLATITFQNYFRMYQKLAGMTGTALTEEEEFRAIYDMDVLVIPTNMPIIRKDFPDCIYKSEKGKFLAIVEEITEHHEKGQPMLVGTISIEKSELVSKLLQRKGIKHQVLNAKFHEKEAEIIAQAGKYGAVTIATNMAGRGTDIVLGGNAEHLAKKDMRKKGYDEYVISFADTYSETDDEKIIEARKVFRALADNYIEKFEEERQKVIDVGGLYVIGTERHESRRIDNQLRGRSGRQGDPGASRFFISLDDDLMRLFGKDRLYSVVNALGLKEDEAIEHKMLSNAIESAQKKVESRNFGIRKHVLDYDDVMNKQREVIYKQRLSVLDGQNIKDNFVTMISEIIKNNASIYLDPNMDQEEWDIKGLERSVKEIFPITEDLELKGKTELEVTEYLDQVINEAYEKREQDLGTEIMREVERVVLLKAVDQKWMDHIDAMDQLRQGIGMRAYGQRDPVIEYKFEGFEMFEEMVRNIRNTAVHMLFNVNIKKPEALERRKIVETTNATHGTNVRKPVVNKFKIGRNEPCPCGSGKKYKDCCGSN